MYSYKDIIKSLIKKLCFVPTKSKVINPTFVGNRLDCAGWEDTIINYVDTENIVSGINNITLKYILYSTAYGNTEDEIAQDLNCHQSTINRNKYKIIKELRELQLYDKAI